MPLKQHLQQLNLLTVGRIGRAHGIQGWLNVISFTEPTENILNYRPWQFCWQNNWKTITVEASRILHNSIIIKLSGCDDRDQAKLYTGTEIGIEPQLLPKLDTGEYYWSDLIGLTVVNQDGVTLGQVTDLLETGSNDVLVIGKHLIPYLPGEYVVDIDLKNKIMRVIWDPDF